MPGVDGHNMTSIEDGSQSTNGGSDGATDAADQKNNHSLAQPGGAAGSDGSGEDQEAGEGSGADEGVAGEEGERPAAELDESPLDGEPAEEEGAPGPLTPEAISEMVAKSVTEAMEKNKPAAAPELTDEQWSAKEAEVGASRSAIQFFTGQAMKVYNTIQAQIDARFAKIERADSLRGLARTKGYEDAMRYPKGIDQFLSKYEPRHHANPELLKMAVVYARGLAASNNVRRARVETERNRRITGPARPSSPGSNGASRRPGSSVKPLNQTQREVAAKFGMSDAEYSKLKNGSKVVAV